jgi:hypothetical protein
MTTYSLKANTDIQDPAQDDASFADLICNQIHSLVSQHHQHGKLGPERTSNELLDLAAAVKHIAEQYTADHLPHSPSAVGHTDDNEFLNLFSIFSSSPSSDNQEDFGPRTPTSDLPTRLSPSCTTDDNHRWLSEQPSNDLTFPCTPSYGTDFSAVAKG